MSENLPELTSIERIALRDRLRVARYAALADAEGFHEICYAVEALGMRLHGSKKSIHSYWNNLKELATYSPLFGSLVNQFPSIFTRFDALYESLRQARNDAMHSGAYARYATLAAIELCIGLEESLMNAAEAKLTVADYMVKTPVCIEPWQPVAYARQIMLIHSFSFLPIFHQCRWKLLSELAVASYLHPMTRSKKEIALATSIEEAVNANLKLIPAKKVKPSDMVSNLLATTTASPAPTLWLVVEAKNRLVGILSPFELM